MNMAFHYPIIYWNTANLIVDSGSIEEMENKKSTDYGKIATAIANMVKRGINVTLPTINEAKFGFTPDEPNNRIIYGLKSLVKIGDDVSKAIIENQPYASMDDFYTRMYETGLVKTAQIIQLIKAGSFTLLHSQDRRETMLDFLQRYVVKTIDKLTFSQFESMKSMDIIPEHLKELSRLPAFKRYILSEDQVYKLITETSTKHKLPKAGYYDRWFVLDDASQPYFLEWFGQDLAKDVYGEYIVFSEKELEKKYKEKIQPLVEWFGSQEAVDTYNNKLLELAWDKHARGVVPKWEMDSLSFYYTEHELAHLDEEKYGIVDYFQLPENPEAYDYYVRWIKGEKKFIPKNKISRLAGTVLDCNKDRHLITLLTVYGVVNVKYNKGEFQYYNRRISEAEDSGKKKVLEESWFKRGSKIFVCGYREGDVFRAYRYADTIYPHTTSLIKEVNEDGTVFAVTERVFVG